MTQGVHDMHCQEFVELVTDYLEGALAPRDVARLEAHLGDCDECAHYLAQLEVTIELTARVPVDPAAPHLHADLVDVFARWHADRD